MAEKKKTNSHLLPLLSSVLAILIFSSVLLAIDEPAIDEQKLKDYQSAQEAGNWNLYLQFMGLPSAGVGSPALMLSLIVVIIAALAYMAGHLLQIEELTQFSKAELFQAGVTVLIVAAILSVILATNIALEYSSAQTSSPCAEESLAEHEGEPLVLTYAYCYMASFSRLAQAATRDSLHEGLDYASDAYSSVGYMSDRWWTAYAGFTMRPNAHKRLDSEIKGLEFQNLQNSLISMVAQKFVLEKIIPTLGPAALFLGILLRALVYTRRLGGLLMAIGVGLLLVWPATYLLAWISLQSAIFGQQAQTAGDGLECPASCQIEPPFAYLTSQNDGTEMGEAKTLDRSELIAQIEASFGSDELVDLRAVEKLLSKGIQTCYPDKDYGLSQVIFADSENCPKACRYLPTPINCDIGACTNLPNACKAIRQMNMNDEADNCIQNSEWACPDDAGGCPEYCKMKLPQVQYGTGEPYSYDSGIAQEVVPSENANACGEGDCLACSYYWRRYIDSGESESISEMQACQRCLANSPDCMLGIPALLGRTCDNSGACGQKISLSDYIEAEASGSNLSSCPVDCRINFDEDAEKYRDGLFVKYCTPGGTKYISACNACPIQCKLNASASLGASSEIKSISMPGLGRTVECAEAPTFDQTTFVMDKTVNNECKRCPLQCRFTNPSSIKDPASIGMDAFLSSVHYRFPCYYYPLASGTDYPCGIKINYNGACTDSNYPNNWFAFSSIASSGNCGSVPEEGEVPLCAPQKEVYYGSGINPIYCPKFMVDSKPYVDGKLQKLTKGDDLYYPGVLLGWIPANPDVSGECTTEDVAKFCQGADEGGVPYCPDSCKVERVEKGPFYCSVDSITSAYAKITSNTLYCDECYTQNSPTNNTGPQCQAMLLSGTEIILSYPYGCSEDKCSISSGSQLRIDPLEFATKEKNGEATGCYGFCYPRLQIPLISACKDYEAPPEEDANSREFANCAACPLECRYDYSATGKAALPAGVNEYCVYDIDGNTYPDAKRNCDHACTGTQPAAQDEWASWVGECEDNNAYSCSLGSSGTYWVRDYDARFFGLNKPIEQYCADNFPDAPADCCKNVVLYDGDADAPDCLHYKQGDLCCVDEDGNPIQCPTNWYQSEDICNADAGLFSWQESYTPNVCARGHKYPELDTLINAENQNYNECGDLSLTTGDGAQNPDLHLCGSVGSGTYTTAGGAAGITVSICKNDATAQDSCYAHYNSLYVGCLQQTDISKEVPPPAGSPHLADESCQQCPLFCRVDVAGTEINYNQICNAAYWTVVGPKPECAVPSQCDMRTSAGDGNINYGYCGVNIKEFSLAKTGDGDCQLPATGEGIGCPSRCRVIIESGDLSILSAECTTGDIGDACENLIAVCRAEPPSRLCQNCLTCQKDCLALPYVRQNCDELCIPSDNLKGRSGLSPQDLVSSWNGAAGNTGWRNIASLAIAAYVLPIFCLLITLSFIRSLSPLLGGDIEIPGLTKLLR